MEDRPLRYLVVGSGWRSLFYWRISQAYPALLKMQAMLCRTQEKAEYMRCNYGIPAVTAVEECESCKPDFIVVAVNKAAIAKTAMEWVDRGYPVLLETPAAMEVKTLQRLWQLRKESGKKLLVAEQYFLFPSHAAAIAAVRHGYLGDPYAIDLSTAHDYHAASLVRRYLGLGMEPVTIKGEEYFFPIEETDSRYGAVADGTVKKRRRVRAVMEFLCGQDGNEKTKKKYAFYDFDGVQYHSKIRSRHVRVMGQIGELDDNILSCVTKEHLPQKWKLTTETEQTGGIRRVRIARQEHCSDHLSVEPILYENPFVRRGQAMVLPEDETAVGTILLAMRRLIEENAEIYPFRDALQDAYISILMEEAVRTGKTVHSEPMPWM